jgi:phage shock protein C
MFCPQCGKQVDANSRFCPSCGATISSTPPPQYSTGAPYSTAGQLTRSRENRMIAGICAGFAQHYGWDLNLTRILTVIIIFFTGVGLFVYLALWIILPEAPYALPVKTT